MAVKEGFVDFPAAYSLVRQSIASHRSSGYSWNSVSSDQAIVALYVRNNDSSEDYFVIKSSVANEAITFKAFLVSSTGGEKYLGSESGIDSLKSRIENYALIRFIRDYFDQNILTNSTSVHETRDDHGLER